VIEEYKVLLRRINLLIAIILVIVMIPVGYGLAYWLSYHQATNAMARYDKNASDAYWSCQEKVQADNRAALARHDVNNGVETCQVVTGGSGDSIGHGFLWLPVFTVDGMPNRNGVYGN